MKINFLATAALAYNVDMMQSSMRQIGAQTIVLEEQEEVVLEFLQNGGTGYSWIGNVDGENVSLVNRWTGETGNGLLGGPKNDYWQVHADKAGSQLVRMADV